MVAIIFSTFSFTLWVVFFFTYHFLFEGSEKIFSPCANTVPPFHVRRSFPFSARKINVLVKCSIGRKSCSESIWTSSIYIRRTDLSFFQVVRPSPPVAKRSHAIRKQRWMFNKLIKPPLPPQRAPSRYHRSAKRRTRLIAAQECSLIYISLRKRTRTSFLLSRSWRLKLGTYVAVSAQDRQAIVRRAGVGTVEHDPSLTRPVRRG